MRTTSLILFTFALVLCIAPCAHSQVPDPAVAAAAPVPGAGHHYIGLASETVNPADGLVHFNLPVSTPAGRQLSLPFGIRYGGPEQFYLRKGRLPNQSNQSVLAWDSRPYTAGEQGGWSYDIPMLTASARIEMVYTTYTGQPPQGAVNHQCDSSANYVFRGMDGAQYTLNLGGQWVDPQYTSTNPPTQCNANASGTSVAHGITATIPNSWNWANQPPITIADYSGTIYHFPGTTLSSINPSDLPPVWATQPDTITDRNGNQLIGLGNSYKDTLGRTVVSWTGIGNDGDQISVSGLSSNIVVHWTNVPVTFPGTLHTVSSGSTSVNCTLGSSATSSAKVVSEVDLPNGQKYTFTYDPNYGRVSKIIFPGGGYVRYVWGLNHNSTAEYFDPVLNGNQYYCDVQYDTPAVTDRYLSYDGTTEVFHQHFRYSTVWNTSSPWIWNTKSTKVTSTDLLTNQVATTIYSYVPGGADPGGPYSYAVGSNVSPSTPVESSVVYQDGNGHTVKTVNKTWLNAFAMIGQQTILDNGQGTASLRCYDTNEQVTDVYEYGFQSEGSKPADPSCAHSTGLTTSAIGPLRRHTVTAYHNFLGATPSTHIVNEPDSITVYDSSGNLLKQTTFEYTSCPAPQASGAINLVTPATLRGDVCSSSRWVNTTSSWLKTTNTYWDTGQLYTSTDPRNNSTTYSYVDNFTNGTGTPNGQTNAFLTQVTYPNTGVAHIEKLTYGYSDSQRRTHVDQNNLSTSYQYNDPFVRPTLVNFPDNGQAPISYNDPALTVTTSRTINATQTATTVTIADGLGHVKQTQLTTDPQGTVYTDTTYDGFGRVRTVSNPYRSGSDPTTSAGITTYAYDVLGRKISETYPDGSVLTTAYCGASTLVTDPTGKWRRSRVDGLGFLVEVDEPNVPGVSVNSCPGTGEPIWITNYSYDTLGNLTQVVQNGSHQRSFSYDSLSRLLTSANPEVGTITYKYDSDSNCANPNSFAGLLVSKTDARGIRTCAQYDATNRETVLNYSNGDPTITTVYDGTNCLGLTACQNIGQRTSMTDAAGSESWAYQVDSANRRSIHVNQRTTNSITKTSSYYLDLAANLTQVVYPTGRVVNYSYNAADRPVTATDGSNGVTYATDFQTTPTGCLSGAVCYTPQGTFYALSIGQSSTFAGLNLTHTYNSRLQPNEFKASSSGGNAIDITYNFVDPVSGHNAGHVYGITNNLDITRSQVFTYDQLNRISSALTTSTEATSPSHCWGETYTLDAWGNLNAIAATPNSAYTGCSQESGFSVTADGNNHLPTWAYDPSGNATSDGYITNYQWDAESQLKSAAGVNYLYDGDGRRVSKVGSKLYWYGSGGDILAETDASGNTNTEYIFFGGKRLANISPGTPSSSGTGSASISGSEQSIAGAAAASGTGSVTFSGTLQSKQVLSQAATSGAGAVTLSGTLQSTQVLNQAATSGTGSVSISGTDRSVTIDPCQGTGHSCPQTIWDTGSIVVTVNGVQAGSAGYAQGSSPGSIATALASNINSTSSYVTATPSGSTVNLTAKTTGASTNYSLTASSATGNTQYFTPGSTSFPVSTSGSTLTGGSNATYTTVYDSGTCTITVNLHGDPASWSGSGTTSSSIASALVSSINADSAASVSASPSGSTVNLSAKTTGSATNYGLSSSCSYDTSHFSSGSFSTSNSGSALTGGKDAVYNTIYDSGSSTITVNSHPDTVSWSGSGTTSSSIASALASNINGDSGASVAASASGSTVNLTAKATGASTNYSLSSSNTYDSADFSSASFSSSNSGSALTGGRDAGATVYDSGNVIITISGTQYSVSYGQGSSSSSIASALASAISAGSLANASASGSSVSLTAKSTGASTNYSLSSSLSTSQPGTFSSPSFSISVSGSALTGGKDATQNIFYYVEDMLGTSRVLTSNTGVVCYDADFYPYGGERAYTNTCPQNYKFEGKERDAETGNDDFGARYYSNRFGRWLSADWSATPVPVPYANLTNPQTLNLYSMVADDPESFADLDGHDQAPGTVPDPSGLGGCPPKAYFCQDTGTQSTPTPPSTDDKKKRKKTEDCNAVCKEIDNEVSELDNLASDIQELLTGKPGRTYGHKYPSNEEEEQAMNATSVAIFFVPFGEVGKAGKVEKIAELTAEAEKAYPKLAGKPQQLHHVIPKYLGGAIDGLLKKIPAAYHQLITNEFRRLAPYGRKYAREFVQNVIQRVYKKFPLP